ncbi:MAG: hypothetical protein ACREH8_20070 [Opitutaceae bacterium]
MNYTEAYRFYLAALQKKPKTPPPQLRMETTDEFHAWKSEMRGYDAARIELQLATPHEIQAENAAVQLKGRTARIVQHARYP